MREEIISFHQSSDGHAPFLLEMAGMSYCDGSYRIERHDSAVTVFEHIIKGRGHLRIGGRSYEPEAGDTYIVPEGTSHCYYSSADQPWKKIWFNVRGPMAGMLLNVYQLSGVYHVEGCNLEQLFRQGLAEARLRAETIHNRTALLLHQIVQEIATHQLSEQASSDDAARLKKYLDARIEEEVTLTALAALICRSESQMIRIFKAAFGCTPYQYHLSQKIRAAESLLFNTVMSVKQVAYRLGFCDEYYFSNLFKRKTGSSPSGCRAQHQKRM